MCALGNPGWVPRPNVECIPVRAVISAKPPHYGTWNWYCTFYEERLDAGKILPWIPCGRKRKVFKEILGFDESLYLIPRLHLFIFGPGSWRHQNLHIVTDEEGYEYCIDLWDIVLGLSQMRLSLRETEHDFEYNFYIDPSNLKDQMRKAYCTFGKGNGLWWHDDSDEP